MDQDIYYLRPIPYSNRNRNQRLVVDYFPRSRNMITTISLHKKKSHEKETILQLYVVGIYIRY